VTRGHDGRCNLGCSWCVLSRGSWFRPSRKPHHDDDRTHEHLPRAYQPDIVQLRGGLCVPGIHPSIVSGLAETSRIGCLDTDHPRIVTISFEPWRAQTRHHSHSCRSRLVGAVSCAFIDLAENRLAQTRPQTNRPTCMRVGMCVVTSGLSLVTITCDSRRSHHTHNSRPTKSAIMLVGCEPGVPERMSCAVCVRDVDPRTTVRAT